MAEYSRSSDTSSKDLPLHLSPNKKLMLQVKARDIQLQKELKSLAKANKVDVQSQQAKELQFRTKYEKYLTRGNFESSLLKKEAYRKSIAEMSSQIDDFKTEEHIPLHKLIFTNGEVDIEKVVCLHLLTAHSVESDLVVKNKSFSLFPKRSKPNMLEASALPFFILEIIHKVNTEPNFELREGQDVVIMVNNHLEKLVVSILEVLAIVSPQKLQLISELAFSKRGIQEIMIKPKIHNFLAQIKECPELFTEQNYRLGIARYQTEPSLVANVLSLCLVRIKDRSGKMELIQKEIKAIITRSFKSKSQSDDSLSWSMFHQKLCSCNKLSSKNSMTLGKGISLLHDDGREFALVTGSGCHLPTGTSEFYPSLTAIIKSSPRPRGYSLFEQSSRFAMNQKRGFPILKNDQKKLISSLLHKVNNSDRILIGKKAAELKSQNIRNNKKQKIQFSQIIEDVFSKESLISFASTTENEELKLLFQPCCKGGLGIGSILLQPEKPKPNKTLPRQAETMCQCRIEAVPQLIRKEKSLMNTAIIKQEIFTSETRRKVKQFLQSENPG